MIKLLAILFIITLKQLLIELKNFNVQAILVSDYKKRNNCKIFHSSAKVIANDSGIDEVFKMVLKIMTKIKKTCLRRLDCLGCNYKAQY